MVYVLGFLGGCESLPQGVWWMVCALGWFVTLYFGDCRLNCLDLIGGGVLLDLLLVGLFWGWLVCGHA